MCCAAVRPSPSTNPSSPQASAPASALPAAASPETAPGASFPPPYPYAYHDPQQHQALHERHDEVETVRSLSRLSQEGSLDGFSTDNDLLLPAAPGASAGDVGVCARNRPLTVCKSLASRCVGRRPR